MPAAFTTSSLAVNRSYSAVAVSQPVMMTLNMDAADGSATTNPYAGLTWSAMGKEIHEGNGRVLCNGAGRKRLELIALFSDAAGEADIQLFGFTHANRSDYLNIGSNNASMTECPAGSGIYLGPAYPVSRNEVGSPTVYTLTAKPELMVGTYTQRTTYKSGALASILVVPMAAQSTFYWSVPLVLNAAYYAYLVYLTRISAGTVIVLGRTY